MMIVNTDSSSERRIGLLAFFVDTGFKSLCAGTMVHDVDDESEKERHRILGLVNICLLTSVAVFGSFTNLVCLIVIKNSKLKGSTFRYMFANSFSDFVLNTIYVFNALFTCEPIGCSISKSYAAQFYRLYIFFYIGNSLELFSNLIDLALAFDRLFIISAKNFARKIGIHYILTGLFVFAFAFYLPFTLSFNVERHETVRNLTQNESAFELYFMMETNDFGTSNFGVVFITILTFIRGFLLVFVIFLVNLIMLLKMRKQLAKKKYLQNAKANRPEIPNPAPPQKTNQLQVPQVGGVHSIIMNDSTYKQFRRLNGSTSSGLNAPLNNSSSDRNMTFMVMTMCSICIIGNVPISIGLIYRLFDSKSFFSNVLRTIVNITDVLSHSTYLFVYYYFNKKFRLTIKRIMLSIDCFSK